MPDPTHLPAGHYQPTSLGEEADFELDSRWEMVMRQKPGAGSDSSAASVTTPRPPGIDDTGAGEAARDDCDGTKSSENYYNMCKITAPGGSLGIAGNDLALYATTGISGSERLVDVDDSTSLKLFEEPVFQEFKTVDFFRSDDHAENFRPRERGPYFTGMLLNRAKHLRDLNREVSQILRTKTIDTNDSGISVGSGSGNHLVESEQSVYSSRASTFNEACPTMSGQMVHYEFNSNDVEVSLSDCKQQERVGMRRTLGENSRPTRRRFIQDLSSDSTRDAGAQFESRGSNDYPPQDSPAESGETLHLSGADEEDLDFYSEDTSWMSDYSDQIWEVDETHPLYAVKDSVTQRGLLEYRQWKNSAAGNESTVNQAGKAQLYVPTSSRGPSKGQPKRDRAGGSGRESDDEDDEDDNGDERPHKKPTGSYKPIVGQRLLACPFAKRNPSQYRKCYGYTISRIQDVKQHIWRCHQMPIHCLRCRTTFNTDEELRRHARNAISCEIKDFPVHDGVTTEQIQKLKKRVSVKNSLEDQWREVFGILFPDDPYPNSVFVEPGLTLELRGFMDFMYQKGPEFIRRELQQRGMDPLAYEESNSSRLLQAGIRDGLRSIANEWLFSPNGPPSLTDSGTTDSFIEVVEVSRAATAQNWSNPETPQFNLDPVLASPASYQTQALVEYAGNPPEKTTTTGYESSENDLLQLQGAYNLAVIEEEDFTR